MWKVLKKYFITGILIWLPLLMTMQVLRLILHVGDYVFAVLPQFVNPKVSLGFAIPGLGLLLTLMLVVLTGLFAANVLGKILVGLSESLLARIPLLRSVYSGVKRCLQVFFTTNKSFQQVVLVEYPRKGIWSLAFVTNDSPQEDCYTEPMTVLFIPTTPNPTSGYILIVPKRDVQVLDMSIDDAIQFVISLGTAGELRQLSKKPLSE